MNDTNNPFKVLEAKSQQAWSGCIEIEEPKDPSVSWQVYLIEGKIQYVNSTKGQQERLNYLWQKLKLSSNCPELVEQTSEYEQLCECLSNKGLEDSDFKKLLFQFIQEGLVKVLSIDETAIKVNPVKRIKKAIINLPLSNFRQKDKIQAWQEIRSYLDSPFSRLFLEQKNALQFYKIWKNLYEQPELASLATSHKISYFVSLFIAKNSFYELVTKINFDSLILAKYLKQCLEEKIITLLPFAELKLSTADTAVAATQYPSTQRNVDSNSNQLPLSNHNKNLSHNLIVCIDDSKTVQRQVKMTLETAGYQVMGIIDPTFALRKLSLQQPVVIFMDINMPNINGYDLCSMLRKSQKFKEIPIVMLTGRDGMIDRVRAKLAGATDYLTKPCDPNKLIELAKRLEKSGVVIN